MALFKCKMCGGDLEIAEGTSIAECEYCGTKQTVPQVMDENLQNLFNRANTLRIKSEFDKAEKLYEKIIQADTTQADAYWGLILCKYGIEYVDDPATFKKIPTCHRASYDSIIADDDYKAAIENADMSQRAIYEEQAKEIDRIQKDILALAQKEETYDVFICYKETDANGQRTQDSVIANDIYYQLTQEGFKVFYAAITLEGKLGSAYEPIIFAALNSAKVMLSIGTKPEYFNAVWVKNEWSRYLKIIKNDRSKLLIPCYRDMDAYELPEEFAHLQAQDMAKIGFINDLVRGIKKITETNAPKTTVVKETIVPVGNANIAAFLKRVFIFLEDGDWTAADEYCEKVLDIDPECAEAYLGKMMAELRVRKQEDLNDAKEPFDGSNNYQKAIRFGDEKLKTILASYIEHINTRNETARLDRIYTNAKTVMSAANTESAYKEAARIFESISEYLDSASLEKECYEKAETTRKDAILSEAKSKPIDDIYHCKEAIKLLESITGWRDADAEINYRKERIEELTRLENEKKARLEAERKKSEKRAKRNKMIAIIAVIAIIASFLVIDNVIIPNVKYNAAITLMDEGKYKEAIAAFEAMDGYKDSVAQIENCFIGIYGEKLYNTIKNINVGDTFKFGSYEQDNDMLNGKEEIEWIVVDKDGASLCLVSKYALDCQHYNASPINVTWEKCSLRKWLNSTFINSAFSAEEQAMISTLTVSADKDTEYSTDTVSAPQDKVFLLSITESNKYFTSDEARMCAPTDYAIAQGVWTSDDYKASGRATCWWWLRSSGAHQNYAAGVDISGGLDEYGDNVTNDDCAVRPAMWIELGD